MSNLDKGLLGRNIKYLASQKGIKLGDLEAQVAVSAGYFSRLSNENSKKSNNENSKSSTLVDVIINVAEQFNVSIDALVSTDLEALTPNEKTLSQFFDRLYKDTIEDKLVWDKQSENNFIISIEHPLIYQSPDFQPYYHSLFDDDTKLSGDVFKVCINYEDLYLIHVINSARTVVGFELYFCFNNNENIEPVCRLNSDSKLYVQVLDLYKAASESSNHLKLSSSVIQMISDYMNH